MNRRASEILARYRAEETLGEDDRARLLGAIRERIAGGAAMASSSGSHGASKVGESGARVANGAAAKGAAIATKVVLGFVLVAAPGAYWLGTRQATAPSTATASARSAPAMPAPRAATAPSPAATDDAPKAATEVAAPAVASSAPVTEEARRSVAARHVQAARHASRAGGGGPALDPSPAPAGTSVAAAPAAPAAAPQAAAPDPQPAPSEAPSPPQAAPAAPAKSAPAEVDEEVRLVGQAYSLMHAGDAERALDVLDEHERRFPEGKLAESRRATRILALCQAGRTGDAQAARQRFLARYPHSPFTARVRAACPDAP